MDNPECIKTKFSVTLIYENVLNPITQEVKTTLLEKTIKDVTPKQNVPNEYPQLFLTENKCQLNQKAIELTNFLIGDLIDIRYADNGINGNVVPVIGNINVFDDKGGIKLMPSLSFTYKGKKNKDLSQYSKLQSPNGVEFFIIKHPTVDNLFILSSELTLYEEVNSEPLPDLELTLDDLEEDIDSLEITSNYFNL
jgi:hypothetical protein